jgi:predicted PurR-regulated permease PerM
MTQAPPSAEPTRQSRASMYAFLLILAGFGLLFARMILPYLMAIAVGGVLALLAQPLFRRLRAKGWGPTAASSVVTIGLIVVVIGPLLAVSSLAVKQALTLGQVVVERVEGMSLHDVLAKVSDWGPIDALIESPEAFEAVARKGLSGIGQMVTTQLLGLAKGVPDAMLQLVLACMACFFLLTEGKTFVTWLADKVPIDLDVRGRLTGSFKDTAISVVWASMAAAATQAGMMFVGFLALRVPAAALAGGMTFIFAWIPLIGSGPVWIAGAGYLWFNDAPGRAGIMIALGIATSLVDNVVRPWVLKGRGEMHPLVSLVAIFGGIQMFGLFGVFAGPILAAVVITLLQVWPSVGRRAGLAFPKGGIVETSVTTPTLETP